MQVKIETQTWSVVLAEAGAESPTRVGLDLAGSQRQLPRGHSDIGFHEANPE